MPKGVKQPARERFEMLVNRGGECHEWKGGKHVFGYGQFHYEGRMIGAHRMAWYLAYGKWPDNQINHICCNPACVRVDHLEDVTRQEDIDYKVKLGRQTKGSQHGTSKLTEVQIESIRIEYAAGGVFLWQLAEKYGVSREQIGRIVNKKQWRHVA